MDILDRIRSINKSFAESTDMRSPAAPVSKPSVDFYIQKYAEVTDETSNDNSTSIALCSNIIDEKKNTDENGYTRSAKLSRGATYSFNMHSGLGDLVWTPIQGFKNLSSKGKDIKNLFCGRIAPSSEAVTSHAIGIHTEQNELVEIFGLHQNISYMAKFYYINRDKLHPYYDITSNMSATDCLNVPNNLDKTWDERGFENLRNLLSDKLQTQDKVKEFAVPILEDSKMISETYLKNIVTRLKGNLNVESNEIADSSGGTPLKSKYRSSDDDKLIDNGNKIMQQIASQIAIDNKSKSKKVKLGVGMDVEYIDKIFNNLMKSRVVDILDLGSGRFEVRLEDQMVLTGSDTLRLSTAKPSDNSSGKGKKTTKASAKVTSKSAQVAEVAKFIAISDYDVIASSTKPVENKKRLKPGSDGQKTGKSTKSSKISKEAVPVTKKIKL
jgi:hypothetical protein